MIEPWKIFSSEKAFDHKWYQLRRDVVRLPNGRVVDDYFVSVRPHGAVVFPVDTHGAILLVRQYKHGVQQTTLEFPAGTFSGENPDTAARRELEEETGYIPKELVELGVCFDDSSKNTNLIHLFLASGCTPSGQQRLDDLELAAGLEVVMLTPNETIRALEDGTIASMSSVAAGYKAVRHLRW